mmetsp:Transcript_42787/g.123683  ORF Transcript_42787/g.123683 Transcript_42787/m.123683 type:complete len:244 (+) Transcript_42787:195-926(+)
MTMPTNFEVPCPVATARLPPHPSLRTRGATARNNRTSRRWGRSAGATCPTHLTVPRNRTPSLVRLAAPSLAEGLAPTSSVLADQAAESSQASPRGARASWAANSRPRHSGKPPSSTSRPGAMPGARPAPAASGAAMGSVVPLGLAPLQDVTAPADQSARSMMPESQSFPWTSSAPPRTAACFWTRSATASAQGSAAAAAVARQVAVLAGEAAVVSHRATWLWAVSAAQASREFRPRCRSPPGA